MVLRVALLLLLVVVLGVRLRRVPPQPPARRVWSPELLRLIEATRPVQSMERPAFSSAAGRPRQPTSAPSPTQP